MGNQLATSEPKNIVDRVGVKIKALVSSNEIELPAGYSAGNALKEALLTLQETVDRNRRSVLEVCTPESIASALLETVVMGLSPAKKQVYYIAYGAKLTAQRSYMGNAMLAKRLNPQVDDIYATVIREGETFTFDMVDGRPSNIVHSASLGTIDNKIVGAYGIVKTHSGAGSYCEIMSIAEIHKSWNQSKQKPFNDDGSVKSNSVHGKFEDQMCKRTVINRLCKKLINTAPDVGYLTKAIGTNEVKQSQAAVECDIQENANQVAIDFDNAEIPEPEVLTNEEIAEEGSAKQDGVIYEDPFTEPFENAGA